MNRIDLLASEIYELCADVIQIRVFNFHEEAITDIDLVLITKKKTNVYDLVDKLSPLLIKFIKKHRVFTSCFPIDSHTFENSNSEFIKNVKEHGKQLKEK